MALKIGITGTQDGLTSFQQDKFRQILTVFEKQIEQIHHGDCVGADSIAHDISINEFSLKIVIHPPNNPTKRAYKKDFFQINKEKDYLERNKEIVKQTDFLIAFPKNIEGELLRSGTWSTVRYARKQNKK